MMKNLKSYLLNPKSLRPRFWIGLGLSALLLPIILVASRSPQASQAAWYDDNFAYRKLLTISSSVVSGSSDLTDFPYLVYISADSDLSSKAQSDGDDILFTDYHGNKLDHEIDTYSSGTIRAWVRIPTLYKNKDTLIYMYYGNANVASQENAIGVWGANHRGVWHLEETVTDEQTSGTHYDSSTYGNNGTQGNNVTNSTAKIGAGQTFDGSGDYISVGDKDSADFENEDFTLMTWFYWNTTGATDALIDKKGTSSSGTAGYMLRTNGAANQLFFTVADGTANGSDEVDIVSSTTFTSGTWYHVAAVWDDDGSPKIYVDGVDRSGTVTGDGVGIIDSISNSISLSMGANPSGSGNELTGDLDEVRIYAGALSGDWIATSYTNQNSPATHLTVASQEKGDGPVAYWKLDEGYGTAPNDAVANYDGTFGASTAAPSWKPADMCIQQSCLYFDGSDDVVTVASTVSAVQSVSFWARVMSTSTTEQLLDLNGTDYLTSVSGTITANGFGTETIYVDGQVSSTITANKWHHITVTTSSSLSASAIKFGQVSTNYGQAFIDEVKFYNYARSAAQVKTDFLKLAGVSGASAAFDNSSAWLSDGLVGYWKMDESAANSCSGGTNDSCDASGNAGDAAWTGNVAVASGKFGNATEFDGTGDYMDVAMADRYKNTSEFTVAAWVYMDTDDATSHILSTYDFDSSSNEHGFIFGRHFGGLGLRLFRGSQNNYISLSSLPSIGAWHHIAATFISGKEVKLYVDGAESAQAVSDSSGTATYTVTYDYLNEAGDTPPLRIGARSDSLTGEFDGKLDDVRLYKRALSPKEVRQLANWGPGPLVYYNFDENTGTSTVNDRSGNGYTGTMGGSIPSSAWVEGKYGSGLTFDGSNDYVSHTTIAGTTVTVSTWFKANSNTSYFARLANTPSFGLYYESSNNAIGFTSYHSTPGVWRTPTNSVSDTDGQWYHTAVVYDGSSLSNDPVIYINGVSQTITEDTTPVGTLTANNGTGHVGNRSAADRTFPGVIDEYRYYNYLRTTSQILEDMNAGHPVGGSPISSEQNYWKYDEQQGQTANDAGLANYDGRLGSSTSADSSDPTWKTSSSCKRNGCLDFDGTSDYVTATGNQTAMQYSISMWIKPDDVTSRGVAEMAESPGSNIHERSLYFDSNGKLVAYNYDGGTDIATSTTTFQTGTWYHIAMVKDASNISIWVNGRKEATTASGNPYSSYTTPEYVVGLTYSSFGIDTVSNQYYDGLIDEVKFYNDALTQEQILIDMNAGSALALGATAATEASQNLSSAGNPPIGHWPMDENTNNTCTGGTNDACDKSGNNYDGALTGATWTTGKYGAALNFDGTDDQLSLTSHLSNFTNLSTGTVSGWFKRGVTAERQVIFAIGENTSSDRFVIEIGDTDQIFVVVREAETIILSINTSDTFADTNWHHFAVVDDNSGSVLIYVDGILRTTTGTNSDSWFSSVGSKNYMYIGRDDRTTGSVFFDGSLDDIKIYDYALSASQVAYEFNRGGPVGHWKFDECSGTTAYDSSGNELNGTITPGASGNTAVGSCTSGTNTEMWYNGATGKLNASLDFDGTDDYVEVAHNAKLNLSGNGGTLAAWIKPTIQDESFTALIDKGNGDSDLTRGYAFYVSGVSATDRKLRLVFQDTAVETSSNAWTVDEWQHVAVTWDGTNAKFYRNGILIHTTAQPAVSFATNSSTLKIGMLDATNNREFDGLIDDVRIYNYAVSETQMKKIMNNSSGVRFGPSEGQP